MKKPNSYSRIFSVLAAALAITFSGCSTNKGNGSATPALQSKPGGGTPSPTSEGGSPPSNVMGGESGGGGGKKEPFFNEIANNISAWIKSGNADIITLPSDVTLEQYKSEMLRVLSNYNITFTDKEIVVDGFPKTCRGWLDKNGVNQIQCNNKQFGFDTPENINEVYRVVHHEFARLACRKTDAGSVCLEVNHNEKSDYRISDYVSAYLRVSVVMRLPINSTAGANYMSCTLDLWGYQNKITSAPGFSMNRGRLKFVKPVDLSKVIADGYWLADLRIYFNDDTGMTVNVEIFDSNNRPEDMKYNFSTFIFDQKTLDPLSGPVTRSEGTLLNNVRFRGTIGGNAGATFECGLIKSASEPDPKKAVGISGDRYHVMKDAVNSLHPADVENSCDTRGFENVQCEASNGLSDHLTALAVPQDGTSTATVEDKGDSALKICSGIRDALNLEVGAAVTVKRLRCKNVCEGCTIDP